MVNVFDIEVESIKDVYKKDSSPEAQQPPEDVLTREKFHEEFKTELYLQDFYTRVEDPAMQLVLTFLPNIVVRIGAIENMLDFGAGPTIHVGASFRETAKNIYMADYLPQNRAELERWHQDKSTFDWSMPLKMILNQEGIDWCHLPKMQPLLRSKVRGIYHCDCFSDPSVDCPEEIQGKFDTLVTIFCVEYCCNTYEEYKQAIKNISKQIRLGGFLVIGGILEETWCSFGGRKFSCLWLTKEMVLTAMEEAGLRQENDRQCVFYEINGMFMLCAKKFA